MLLTTCDSGHFWSSADTFSNLDTLLVDVLETDVHILPLTFVCCSDLCNQLVDIHNIKGSLLELHSVCLVEMLIGTVAFSPAGSAET